MEVFVVTLTMETSSLMMGGGPKKEKKDATVDYVFIRVTCGFFMTFFYFKDSQAFNDPSTVACRRTKVIINSSLFLFWDVY